MLEDFPLIRKHLLEHHENTVLIRSTAWNLTIRFYVELKGNEGSEKALKTIKTFMNMTIYSQSTKSF